MWGRRSGFGLRIIVDGLFGTGEQDFKYNIWVEGCRRLLIGSL